MSFLQSVRNKPPMFTQNTCYSSWRKDFEAFISSNDPDMWIPLLERYERPVIEGTKIDKSYKSMTVEERKARNDERKTLKAIQTSLSMEILKLFKHHSNAYDLWVAIEKRCGGYNKEKEPEDVPQNGAFVAHIQEFDSNSSKCLSCMKLTDSVNRYREDNERLNLDLKNLMEANKILKENEKVSDKKLKAVFEETKEFKAKIFSQQDEVDSYLKIITIIKKELADSQAEVLDLKRKLSNFSTSSLVFDEILQSQRTEIKSKAGLGYHHVPPPKNYLPMPSKDSIKDFVPTTLKADTYSFKTSVNEPITKAELVTPTFVKAENTPPVGVEEVVEVEDLSEESTIKVEKINVKPENFIITIENDERFKGKAKVDNESSNVKIIKKDSSFKSSDNSQSSVKNQKKDKIVDKFEKNKLSTSTSSTSETSTSTCSPKSAYSVNVSVNRPPVYYPPPEPFVGSHWNKSYVERRSCFCCGQQGHVIRDCRLLSLDRFSRGMPRNSSFRNSFSKSFSRRGSHSPISSCASSSPKPVERVNKVVPSRPQVQKHNIVENQSSEPKQVWKAKSTNNTSINKSSEFLKYHKLIDVMIMDDFGLPKSIKAWVSHKY